MGGGSSMRQMATITARNEITFTTKQASVPPRTSSSPAMTGPTMRERLNCSELSATAFGIWAGGTTLVSTAW